MACFASVPQDMYLSNVAGNAELTVPPLAITHTHTHTQSNHLFSSLKNQLT